MPWHHSRREAKLLKEHLSARTGNTRPLCVIGVIVFCDESLTGTSQDTNLKTKRNMDGETVMNRMQVKRI